MTILEAKQQVLALSKRAFDAKLFAGTSGNLSIYLREENLVVITPTSIRYEDMTLEDLVIMNLEGKVLEGRHEPSSEHRLHLALYVSRQDASSVVHTHSPYATAFAVNNTPIPLILVEMIPFLGGSVPVAPIAQPGTPEVGQYVVQAMGDKVACLMGNHGVVTIGETLDQAYIRAEYVEDAAKIAFLAKQNGPLVLIPEEIEMKMKKPAGGKA